MRLCSHECGSGWGVGIWHGSASRSDNQIRAGKRHIHADTLGEQSLSWQQERLLRGADPRSPTASAIEPLLVKTRSLANIRWLFFTVAQMYEAVACAALGPSGLVLGQCPYCER